MKKFFIFCFTIFAPFLATQSHAQAYVCEDGQGHRTVSSTPCEKKGLQASKQTIQTSPKVISAMVITEKREPAQQDPTVLPGQIKMERELRIGTPVTVFILTMMLATIGLFGLLFMRFFRAHHSKLSLRRTDRD